MKKHEALRVKLVSSAALLAVAAGVINFVSPQVAFAGEHDQKTTHTAHMCVVDTAKKAGQFNTLLAALKAADLESVLRGDGPYTVFAPTDEAFKKLPEGTVENLLKQENKDKLKGILLYHVVPGKVYAKDVVKLSSAKTANGKEVKITVDGEKVKVDDAQVVKTDIEARNGVIHVIDKVILPKD
ncbi:MAG: fasciclin domain-containing protein [Candidatus Sumerlaeaceae bacterium]